MDNKRYEANLKKAVKNMVPDDMFQRISQNVPAGNERTMIMSLNNNKRRPLRWISAAVAAVFLLAIGVSGGAYYAENLKVDSIVNIDVNPSIELLTNRNEKVLEANPINDDAKAVIGDMDLKNVNLDIAINALIGSMVKNGYIVDTDNGILVSVQNNNSAKANHMRNVVVANIEDSLKVNKIEASIVNQTVTEIGEAEKFAKENNISVGKAVFVMNLASKNASFKAEELAKLSLRELAELVSKNNINIADIVDYDADDSIWENIAEEVEDIDEDIEEQKEEQKENIVSKPVSSKENNVSENKQTVASQSEPKYISESKAQKIALDHAGLSKSQVEFVKSKLDIDDGIKLYEIDFNSEKYEYDYEINALTGAIQKYDKELKDIYEYKEEKPVSSKVSSSKKISAAEAKKIALNHAGVSAESARIIKAEYDNDDGIKLYEVEFRVGAMEYEYEIDAISGKVLDFDKELDD